MSEPLRGLTPFQAELVETHADLIETVAKELSRKYPRYPYGDFLSLANEALPQAAASFDPALGHSFRSHANARMRWFCIDGVRADRRTSPQWRAAREGALSYAIGVQYDPELTSADDAAAESAFQAQCDGLAAGLVAGIAGHSAGSVAPGEDEIIEEETRRRLAAVLQEQLTRLPERDRSLLHEHYFGGRTLRAISDASGPSYATIRRVHNAAIDRLAARMNGSRSSRET